jgi:chromosome segregation ATPase
MAQPSDLETRVAALETQVAALTERVRHSEQDAAAARVLAGGADRDVSEMRGEIREFRDQNNRVLNVMREDLNTMREDLNTVREDLNTMRDDVGDLRSRMDSLEQAVGTGFIEMRGKFDATAAGLDQITGLLTTLIEQRGEQDDR